ncbi:hypothetical protein [Streptomyces sp. NPDC093707]|uniref:hypothetical protein n=1 Tax=Streptomyces sp. NPDC093707 TaxID=3154984 RepID=UPI00344F5E02
MKTRGSWVKTVSAVAVTAACLVGCSFSAEKPTEEERRTAHLDRVRETSQLGRSEGLAVQRQKIATGTPPSNSTPTEGECLARWHQLGEHEQTPGDRNGFLFTCTSFPAPGMPGYEEAVAEAGRSMTTP